MKVSTYMTQDVKCVRAGESVQEAARIMWEKDCGALPVLDDEQKCVGMITDRDIAMAGFLQGQPLKEISVSQVMSGNLISIGSNEDISQAEKLMQSNQIRRLPVLDAEHFLVGLLSINDIALAYKKDSGREVKANEVAETLASVCSHRDREQPSAVA